MVSSVVEETFSTKGIILIKARNIFALNVNKNGFLPTRV